MSMNVHNLNHLVDGVRQWGSLWAYSCFGFESFNGEILKSVMAQATCATRYFGHLMVGWLFWA